LSADHPVRAEVRVPRDPGAAFDAFLDLDAWWPREFTWSQGVLTGLSLEPCEGGLCTEHGPDGFRCDWGRVRVFTPPDRIVLGWHIGPTRAPEPDPWRASEVELLFAARDGHTTVIVEHREFSRHGEQGEAYRDGMAAGWPVLLEAFAASID
jgi:uncharacterized protein YndB with AHSA1/START domain